MSGPLIWCDRACAEVALSGPLQWHDGPGHPLMELAAAMRRALAAAVHPCPIRSKARVPEPSPRTAAPSVNQA